jgi:hypothetical protein
MTSQLKWVKDLNRFFSKKYKEMANKAQEKMPDIISHQGIGNQNGSDKPRPTWYLAIIKYQVASISEDMEKSET